MKIKKEKGEIIRRVNGLIGFEEIGRISIKKKKKVIEVKRSVKRIE